MSLIIPANTLASGGYAVANSLRFNDGSSDYLNKTLGTATNAQKYTISFWVKRSKITATQTLFEAYINATNFSFLNFNANDALDIDFISSNSEVMHLKTNAVFRDTSAWYHIVLAIDATNGTASDRNKLYINGVQETSFSVETNHPQNTTLQFNTAIEHLIGADKGNGGGSLGTYFDGYMAECVLIDGQQLDPTSFGEFDSDSGIWKPIDVSGLTFGTNGFYLDFEDSAALGDDVSGNGNDFTVNNLTAIDQTTDTCTNNFATANPLVNTTPTYSDGNLTIVTTNGNNLGGVSTIGVNTGKWYAEFKVIANDTCAMLGIDSNPSESARLDASGEAFPGKYVTGYGYLFNGYIFNLGGLGEITYGDTFTTNDIIGIALDLDNNKLYFSKNGTFQNSGDPTSGATGTGAISITDSSSQPTGNYFFVTGDGSRSRASTFSCNFGNPAFTISSGNTDGNGYGNFEYAVPSGYLSLCTANLSEVLG
jgi:hypothetical protein